LNRFISRSAEWNLPFFEVLRGSSPFEWWEKQQKAFEDLKEYLMKLTTLSPPKEGAHLLLYVAAAPAAVSTVLVQEIEEKDQKNNNQYFICL
jgi:hypothetical protein